jgi:hypothetical protein
MQIMCIKKKYGGMDEDTKKNDIYVTTLVKGD